jgi:hypothetical protein
MKIDAKKVAASVIPQPIQLIELDYYVMTPPRNKGSEGEINPLLSAHKPAASKELCTPRIFCWSMAAYKEIVFCV